MLIDDDLAASLQTLQQGGLILYPTDTVWGIGCDATNAGAVARIYQLKNRNEEKSMIVLLADEAQVLQYTSQQDLRVFDYLKNVHKPVTVIYQQAKNLASNLVNRDGSIAIRLVRDKFCIELIRRFGKPIVSTSSNVSGYPPPTNFLDIDVKIKSGVDYIVQHRQDDLTPATPSTVIKLDADGEIIILRP
ncbi:MAG: threonylcarbamoyl-AMP synthase [Ferruginibacter sp.]|nr:threonylcarbamoyl-AMP synthase [Ferruginibacter sp.]